MIRGRDHCGTSYQSVDDEGNSVCDGGDVSVGMGAMRSERARESSVSVSKLHQTKRSRLRTLSDVHVIKRWNEDEKPCVPLAQHRDGHSSLRAKPASKRTDVVSADAVAPRPLCSARASLRSHYSRCCCCYRHTRRIRRLWTHFAEWMAPPWLSIFECVSGCVWTSCRAASQLCAVLTRKEAFVAHLTRSIGAAYNGQKRPSAQG